MKYLILSLCLTLLFGCSDNKKAVAEIKTEQALAQQPLTENPSAEFTKYPTVLEMLKEANDFKEEMGTLKVLSKNGKPLHIQVSKPMVDGDLKKNIVEQTMRDIIYVAFQAFAQTDIDELTITSVPIKFNSKSDYINKYKLTKKVNRETVKGILKKYLNTENFQELFQPDGILWLPSKKFDSLKFQNLDAVYANLGN
jgi:hypothetical protein